MQTPNNILNALIGCHPALAPLRSAIEEAFHLICRCYEQGGTLLCCGNGGSAADADHIVGELMKSFLRRRPLSPELSARFLGISDSSNMLSSLQTPLPAISLVSQSALISAYANDVNAEYVYAQQVLGYGNNRPALLLGLSTSGNSANVVHAVEVANCLGLPSIGITGEAGGKMAKLCSVCLKLPASVTYRVQEYTLPVYHALCAMTEAHFFPGTGEE